ncbi:MAG: TerD family protein [Methylococcales bacterium]|nr:TerD family protein [Methylococcales bacterium]
MTQILQKGANASLTQIMSNNNEALITVEWIKKSDNEIELDIDASAFMLTDKNKIRQDEDFVFYNQSKSLDGSFELITATKEYTQDFNVLLNQIDEGINKIALVLTIHEAQERQQNFEILEKIVIKVINPIGKLELLSYVLDDAEEETALILSEMYRHNGEWKFKAIGQGYINGLDVLANNFGVDVSDSNSTPDKAPVPKKPIIVKYTEAIKPNILKFTTKAKRAKRDKINESGTRLIIDSVLQGILGYQLQHIKTEHRIPNRRLRIDYLISIDDKPIMAIEAKHINQNLSERHISQATSYAYYMKLDFALLTNGIEWQLYYVIPKRLKKYEYHHVFTLNLLNFNHTIAEQLFKISRFGFAEKSLEAIKNKMDTLNRINDALLMDDILEKITTTVNQKESHGHVTSAEVRDFIENNILL